MPTQKPAKKIIPLPQTWTLQDGERHYQVIERLQDVLLVEVRNKAKIHIGYEVALIELLPVAMRNDSWAPLRETYPPSQAFGQLAWAYGPRDLAGARERIKRILDSRQAPKPEDLPPEIQISAQRVRVKLLSPIQSIGGDTYRQLKREGDLAIFKPDRLNGYEVVLIQSGAPHPLDAHKSDYDTVEWFPSSQSWGTNAWSWPTLALAQAQFEFILKHGPAADFRASPQFRVALNDRREPPGG